VTKNATPKKSVEQYEYVKTKSSKKLETELPSRQSSRIAVKLTQMTPSLTEVRVASIPLSILTIVRCCTCFSSLTHLVDSA